MSRRKFPCGLKHPNPTHSIPSHPIPFQLLQPTAVLGEVRALREAAGQFCLFPRASQGSVQSPSQPGWPFAVTCYDCS